MHDGNSKTVDTGHKSILRRILADEVAEGAPAPHAEGTPAPHAEGEAPKEEAKEAGAAKAEVHAAGEAPSGAATPIHHDDEKAK